MESKNKILAAALCCLTVASISYEQDVLTKDEALQLFKADAEKARLKAASMTFEEFKATVTKEHAENGKYIVDGDTPISNDKELEEFFKENILEQQITLS